jgi:hypothetical protein
MAGNPFTVRWDTECLVCDGALWEGDEARWSREHDGPVHPDCHEDADTLCANCDEPITGELAATNADGEPVHNNCRFTDDEPKGTTAMTNAPTNVPPWMTGGTPPAPTTPGGELGARIREQAAANPTASNPGAAGPPTGLPPWMTQAAPTPAPAPDHPQVAAQIEAYAIPTPAPASPATAVFDTHHADYVSTPAGVAAQESALADPDPEGIENTATPTTHPTVDWEPDLSVGVTFNTDAHPDGEPGELGVVELSGRQLFGVVVNGQLSHMSYSADQFPDGWGEMLERAITMGGWQFLTGPSGDPYIHITVAELREAMEALRLIPRKPAAGDGTHWAAATADQPLPRKPETVTVPPSQAAKMAAAGLDIPHSTRIAKAAMGTGPSQAAEAERAASVQAAVEGVRAAMGVSFKANEPAAEQPPFDADPTAVDMSGAVEVWNAYVTAKQAEAAARDAAKEARQMLDDYHAGVVEAHPELAGLEQWEINGVVVAKYADVESERFDVKAYREAHPRMAKKWMKKSTTKRLDIL